MSITLDIPALPAHVSYSSFTSYMRCPKSWQLSRVVKVTEHPAWWFIGGRTVHRVTEAYDRRPEGFNLEAEWEQVWRDEVNEQLEKSGDEFPIEMWRAGGRKSKEWPDKQNGEWWLAKGPQMVKDYITWREATAWPLYEAPDGSPAVELNLMAVFADMPVKMALDRVFVPDGMLTVVDLKAGSREPDSSTQLGFYAAGMEYVLKDRPAYGCYFMARKGQTTEPIELDSYTPALIGKWLSAFRRAVDAQAFPPNTGQSCGTCSVARACLAVNGPLALELDPDARD